VDIAKRLEMFVSEINFQKGGSPFEIFELHRQEGEIRALVYDFGYDFNVFRIQPGLRHHRFSF
jgi:hypothetical protein